MGDPLDEVYAHPGVDTVTAKAFVVEQDRRIVGLTTWIRDAASVAGTHGRELQVLTPSHSRLTFALEILLADAGGRWVVRTGLDEFFDGVSGEGLTWTGDAFAPHRRRKGPPVAPAPPGSGDLEVHISSLHKATPDLSLGATTVSAVQALTGHDPLGWGIAEPATEPWSRRSVTAAALARAPKPTHLVVAGAEVIGQLRVTRVDTGVHEQLRLSGRPAGDVDITAVEGLARAVSPVARSMFVTANPARLYGLRGSRPTMPALPFAALVGHQVVAGAGGRAHLDGLGFRPTVIETAYGPAAWYRFDTGARAPYELFTEVLGHFGDLPPSGLSSATP